MGSIGDFLFGGSQSSNTGQQSGSSTSQSQNQSTSSNNSVQAATSGSNNLSLSGGDSYNQAYGPEAAALMPSLGYVTSAGNMIGALLGLPQSNFSYKQTPYTGSPMPTVSPSQVAVHLPTLSSVLTGVTPAHPATATTATPAAQTAPVAAQTPVATPPPVANTNVPVSSIAMGGGSPGNLHAQNRAQGGPVAAGQPYIVGEHQPEMFIPQQSGTIVPQVPGAGPDGRIPPPGSPPAPSSPGSNLMTAMFNATGGRASPGAVQAPPTGVAPMSAATPAATAAPAPAQAAANPTASSALNTFANSAGEQFLLDQGQKALSGASAANGVFDSGATGKALVQYGQNLGNTYLNDYLSHLTDFAKLGLGSASALSGAGGVSQQQSGSVGSSLSTSGGISSGTSQSSGSSTGSSVSSGTSSGSGSSKKGLI